jgi:biotin transporter BioY
LACIAAEVTLFACGLVWLVTLIRVPWAQAAHFGLYPFVFAEVIKVLSAAGIASRVRARPIR